MNYILGSGLIGLLAREILGPDWTIIPFYRSRLFTFNPSLSDNFIVRNDEIDEFVRKELKASAFFDYKIAYSINGLLYKEHDDYICKDWCSKVFGLNYGLQLIPYHEHFMSFDVYDLRCNQLYAKLQEKYSNEIKKNLGLGIARGIQDHKILMDGKILDYDKIVSTIPLNALSALMGKKSDLAYRDTHFLHIQTQHIDFEGHNQALVVDKAFPFYKVTKLSENRYLFYFSEDLSNPGQFFMGLFKSFDILDGTCIKDYVPCGPMPNLTHLEESNILCVGSYAQHDWCMDVSSCILRLLRYSNRGLKEAKAHKNTNL